MSKKDELGFNTQEIIADVVINFDTTYLNAKDKAELERLSKEYPKLFQTREEILALLTTINIELASLDTAVGKLHAKADKKKAKKKAKKNNQPNVPDDFDLGTEVPKIKKKEIKKQAKAEKKAAKKAKKESKADHPAKA